ncbi:MAG: SH3 domain-containing protein [Chloroflexi bacterium]|nr:SH3 domain-containing protein [Chloroflexota bacterium]
MAPVSQGQDDKPAEPSEGIALMRVYGSDLPACSVFQASLLTVRLVLVHDAVINRASELESMDDLLAFVDEEISQRIWSMMPQCAEAIEVGWFVSQVTGDFAAGQALGLAGISPDANLYQGQAERGSTRFDEIYAYVHSEGWSEPLRRDDGNLEACTVSELASLDDIAWDFEDLLVGPALKIQTSGDLIEYGEAHVNWRAGIWASLPACRESVQLGVLMGAIASDFAIAFALSLSGIDTNDNPYMLRALGNWLTFLDRTIMKDFAEDTGNAAKTYYVTANPYANIRSCASTSCGIVATAQNGEALTVIDDSKDWYEIRLENGETAFIAGFLMSENPPNP